jgi:hypothetical protein
MTPVVLLVSMVRSDCGAMAGAVVSCTVTRNDPVLVCSLESMAEHVTVVVPKPKVLPEAGVQVTGTLPSTRSMAVAENVTTAPLAEVASTVMLPGRERTAAGSITLQEVPGCVPGIIGRGALHLVPDREREPEDGVQVTGTI